jgi:ABC-type amino acid transport substrate-binding protein
VSFEPVQFADFFTKDGVIPQAVFSDEEYTYTPDLLERTHFYAGALSPLPWRERFLSFVDLHPSRLVHVIRQGTDPGIAGCPGIRITLLSDSSYLRWAEENLDLDAMEVITVSTTADAVHMVSSGEADCTLADANLALSYMQQYDNLTFLPTSAEPEMISWATARDDHLLRSILDRTIEYLKTTGLFDAIWSEYYGAPFAHYLELLTKEPDA